MDGLSLLERARQAGLEVRADGSRLLVTGPKRLEGLAQALLAAKAEILAELESEARIGAALRGAVSITAGDFRIRTVEDLLAAGGDGNLPARCFACSNTRWWRTPGAHWICSTCHPPGPAPERIEWREVADA